jgi:hypothetical protein
MTNRRQTVIRTFICNKFHEILYNNKTCVNLNIGYDVKTIEEVEITKFLGPQIDSNLKWKTYIQYITHELSSACYLMGIVT